MPDTYSLITKMREGADDELDDGTRQALDAWPETVERYSGDELVYTVRGTRDPHAADAGEPVRHAAAPRRAPAHDRPRRARPLPARREPARGVPVHRRGVPAQARRRGAGADVRRRGRPGPDEPPLPPARRGAAGDAPVDRLRLRDAVRARPVRAPGRLRQGRDQRRQRRDARRHEGAVLRLRPLRPRDERLHDDQRPGAGDPRDVPQHGRRPAAGEVRARARPGAERAGGGRRPRRGAAHRARHRAGRHPQGGPRPEHLHLLHGLRAALHGRRPGVVHRPRRAQLLLRLDQRVPHRRGRGEPHHAARLHPRQRLHLRRELPRRAA